MDAIRKNPGWSDRERNLFIIEDGKEICRICDHENKPGTLWCLGCDNPFRDTSNNFVVIPVVYLYGWEEIEEMKRQYAISVVEELLDETT